MNELKKPKSRRIPLWIPLVVLLALSLLFIARKAGWIGRTETAYEVTTEKAELRTITRIVSASGKIQPEEEVIIRPDVSGEIIELPVQEGDYVREGDLLVRIKPDIYQAQIDDLNAMLLTQKARMEQARALMLQAEAEHLKNSELYERSLIPELEYLQSKNQYEAQLANFRASEFQILSAEAQLRRAQEELQQTVIRSPRNGTITHLAVEQGERVLGQAQTAGTEMMRVANLEQMEVVVDVNENDIVNVSFGDSTRIEVDAWPNRHFEGIVTEIANSAAVTGEGSPEQVTNYKVTIRISSLHNQTPGAGGGEGIPRHENDPESPTAETPVPEFKPGMSATVDIRTRTVRDVVSVPIQAVTVRNVPLEPESPANGDASQGAAGSGDAAGGRSGSSGSGSGGEADGRGGAPAAGRPGGEEMRRVVFLHDNGVARQVVVETGISDDRYIQVVRGLNGGEEVVTGSYRILSRELNDGDAIRTGGGS